LIKDVQITNYDRFKSDLFKTLQMNYGKASYYKEIMELLTDIFSVRYDYINKLNAISIIKVSNYLDINSEILVSSEIIKNSELKAEAKVIDICKILGGDIYINAIGGEDLYSKENFIKENIGFYFIKMNEITYFQGKANFIPNLSIIDIMMWNAKEAIKQLLQEYTLV